MHTTIFPTLAFDTPLQNGEIQVYYKPDTWGNWGDKKDWVEHGTLVIEDQKFTIKNFMTGGGNRYPFINPYEPGTPEYELYICARCLEYILRATQDYLDETLDD